MAPRRLLRGLLGAFALLVAPASAQELQVYNFAGIPPAQMAYAEQGITRQVNNEVRWYWGTPTIHFGNTGWPVVIARPSSPGELSHHTGGPAAYVYTNGTTSDVSSGTPLPWTVVFSHEVVEMVGNPSTSAQIGGWPREISDPVLRQTYGKDYWVLLDDFITPAWFGSLTGPWDFLHVLSGPYDTRRN